MPFTSNAGMRLVFCLFVSCVLMAENWPQFRGAGSNGVSAESGLPMEWSPQKNILWKAAIPGRGLSSPVVWGDRLFLTTSVEGAPIPGAVPPKHKLNGEDFRHPDSTGVDKRHSLLLIAVEAKSGKILWQQTAYEGPVYDERHKKNSYATPTPVTDGKRVYVSFESQGIYAYSLAGKLLWKVKPGNIGTVGMGPGSSPALAGDVLVCQFDMEEGEDSFIAGYSTRNGELLWKTPRKKNSASWSTPILVKSGGKDLIFASGNDRVVAYDPRSGREVWSAPGVEGNAVPTPVSGLDMVFPTAGYPSKRAFGIRLNGEGERVAWKYEKGTAYVPSPILYGDYLYLLTDRGLLTCIEARTGKVIYEGKRVPKPATFSASPVAYGGRIFLNSEDGETFVIEAGPEFKVAGVNSVDEPVYASPAIANGRLYIRGERHLHAVGSR